MKLHTNVKITSSTSVLKHPSSSNPSTVTFICLSQINKNSLMITCVVKLWHKKGIGVYNRSSFSLTTKFLEVSECKHLVPINRNLRLENSAGVFRRQDFMSSELRRANFATKLLHKSGALKSCCTNSELQPLSNVCQKKKYTIENLIKTRGQYEKSLNPNFLIQPSAERST